MTIFAKKSKDLITFFKTYAELRRILHVVEFFHNVVRVVEYGRVDEGVQENVVDAVVVEEKVERLVRGQADEHVDLRVDERARFELVVRHLGYQLAVNGRPVQKVGVLGEIRHFAHRVRALIGQE